jgi:hypothetical protein
MPKLSKWNAFGLKMPSRAIGRGADGGLSTRALVHSGMVTASWSKSGCDSNHNYGPRSHEHREEVRQRARRHSTPTSCGVMRAFVPTPSPK